ncbi:MAG: hypothetical protein ACRDI2_02100 [Chloroflexota bacterium]
MTLRQVREFAQAQGMDVSLLHGNLLHGNLVYASVPALRSDRVLDSEWLVEFRFDDDQRLQTFQVREGVLGP